MVYLEKVLELSRYLARPGRVLMINVQHDDACANWRGLPCDCKPNIVLHDIIDADEPQDELATWKKVRVNLDYHIEVGKHYYSVPYTLAHKVVDVRFTNSMVEVFHENTRVASHPRSRVSHKHTTLPAHMPRAHQEATNCSGGKIRAWAKSIGPAALSLVSAIIEARPHPEQARISKLSWLAQIGEPIWAGPLGTSLPAGSALWAALKATRRAHPGEQTGSAQNSRGGRSLRQPCKRPRRGLLPLIQGVRRC
ncbi:MAG: hypothetical protein EOM37_17275 [Proteobacteria bacterium]|nr:hypothetical protein [Pseudomonadota bacterium]